jgi:hypothetical protein
MATTTQSASFGYDSLHERRGELVQIGALIPALLERYDLRFPSSATAHVAETVSSDDATSNPPADGLRCV